MFAKPQNTNVCAIVVTYHPDSELPQRLARLSNQVAAIVVVDNASSQPALDILRELERGGRIALISNADNLGVATALNQGLNWACEHGFDWIITLDQDSVINEDAISRLGDAFESAKATRKPAIVGANFIDRLTGVPFVPEAQFGRESWTDIEAVITSGTLVSLEAAQIIGRFRDEFFIDYVDDEYCLRARANGFDVIITRVPLMDHTVGHPKWHRFLGKRLITPHLPAERRYYMSRNFVALAREYWRSQRRLIVRMGIVRIKETILIVLFERDGARKLAFSLRGIVDALRGKMGRLS